MIMQNRDKKVAVTSRSFSRHPILRAELQKRYDHIKFNDEGVRLEGKSLIEYLKGYEFAITALEKLTDEAFQSLPDLKVIGKYGVGLDMIDLEAMSRHGVKIGWTSGVNRRAVSELTLTLMLMLVRRLPEAFAQVQQNSWSQIVGRQLSQMTVGIVGCGNIGKDLVRLLQPFGSKTLAYDKRNYQEFYQEYGVKAVSFEELLHESDIVTLHLPLDEGTRLILDREKIGLMKAGAILINAARGGLIDESALYEALKNVRLGGAGFDVFAVEPPVDNPLLELENVITTPHIGGSSEEAILAMGMAAIEGLENYCDPMVLKEEL